VTAVRKKARLSLELNAASKAVKATTKDPLKTPIKRATRGSSHRLTTPIPQSAKKPTTVLPRPTPEPDSPTEDELLIIGPTEGRRSVKRGSTAKKHRPHLSLSTSKKRRVHFDRPSEELNSEYDHAPDPEEDTFAFTKVNRHAQSSHEPPPSPLPALPADDDDPGYVMDEGQIMQHEYSMADEFGGHDFGSQEQQLDRHDFGDVTAAPLEEQPTEEQPENNTWDYSALGDDVDSSDLEDESMEDQALVLPAVHLEPLATEEEEAAPLPVVLEQESKSPDASLALEEPQHIEPALPPDFAAAVTTNTPLEDPPHLLSHTEESANDLPEDLQAELLKPQPTLTLPPLFSPPQLPSRRIPTRSPMPFPLMHLLNRSPKRPSATPAALLAQISSLRASVRKQPVVHRKSESIVPLQLRFPLVFDSPSKEGGNAQVLVRSPAGGISEEEGLGSDDGLSADEEDSLEMQQEVSLGQEQYLEDEETPSDEEQQQVSLSLSEMARIKTSSPFNLFSTPHVGLQSFEDASLRLESPVFSDAPGRSMVEEVSIELQEEKSTLFQDYVPTFTEFEEPLEAEQEEEYSSMSISVLEQEGFQDASAGQLNEGLTSEEEESEFDLDVPALTPIEEVTEEEYEDQSESELGQEGHEMDVDGDQQQQILPLPTESIFYVPEATPPPPGRFDELALANQNMSPKSPTRQEEPSSPPVPEPVKSSPPIAPAEHFQPPSPMRTKSFSAIDAKPPALASHSHRKGPSTSSLFSPTNHAPRSSLMQRSAPSALDMLRSPIRFGALATSKQEALEAFEDEPREEDDLIQFAEREEPSVPTQQPAYNPLSPAAQSQRSQLSAARSPFRSAQASELLFTPPAAHASFSSLAMSGGSSQASLSDEEGTPRDGTLSRVARQILSDIASSPSAGVLSSPLPSAINSFLTSTTTKRPVDVRSSPPSALSPEKASPEQHDSQILVQDPDAPSAEEGKRRSSLNMRTSTPARPSQVKMAMLQDHQSHQGEASPPGEEAEDSDFETQQGQFLCIYSEETDALEQSKACHCHLMVSVRFL
jgi:hypothetical protein